MRLTLSRAVNHHMAGRLAVTALLLLARAALALVPTFNILDYGAVADNATLNTAAIQRAIGAAAAVGAEAHVLVPPPGVFKTGALALATRRASGVASSKMPPKERS